MTEHGNTQRSCVTKQLTSFNQVERLYSERLQKDFARDEIKPLASMRRAWKNGIYDCYGLFSEDKILGYAFFVRLGRDYLLDYLAVEEHHRDEGLGSLFLRQLAECLAEADRVVCEVEDPDTAEDKMTCAQRERRLEFYLRSGYRKTSVTAEVFGVDYRILELSLGGLHSDEQLRDVYTEFYRATLPAIFFRTCFRTDIKD